MSRGGADVTTANWNGMMAGGNGLPFMPGLFGTNGAPDPAAIAAAYAQLQQQSFASHQQGSSQERGRYGGRAAYPPDRSGIKKCGHCQSMKPCVEFSADTSRGDGLRGWCKMCEAEARSTRYKKRKAAAQAAAAARRRFEVPLGGMFWNNNNNNNQEEGSPNGQQQMGNMDPQAMQQQILAMLAFQQQQQQQAANGGSQNCNGLAGAKKHGGSAFSVVGRGGNEDIRAAAFAAANGHTNGGSHGSGSASGISGGSPTTSDSGTSAMERFKKQRIGCGPPCSESAAAGWAAGSSAAMALQLQQQLQQMAAAQQQAAGGRPPNMRTGSEDTDDSAAAMALAFGPAAAAMRLPLGGVGGLSAAQHAALAHAMPPGAPLPPQEVHVPKRKRTSAAGPSLEALTGPASNGLSTVPKSTKYRGMVDLAALPGVAHRPVARKAAAAKQSEVVQWASRMMATLLLARAAAASGCPLALPLPPQPAAKPQAAKPQAAKPPAAKQAPSPGAAEEAEKTPAPPQAPAADAAAAQPDEGVKDQSDVAAPASMPTAVAEPAAAESAAQVEAAPAADAPATAAESAGAM